MLKSKFWKVKCREIYINLYKCNIENVVFISPLLIAPSRGKVPTACVRIRYLHAQVVHYNFLFPGTLHHENFKELCSDVTDCKVLRHILYVFNFVREYISCIFVNSSHLLYFFNIAHLLYFLLILRIYGILFFVNIAPTWNIYRGQPFHFFCEFFCLISFVRFITLPFR
jgi:hypothetical protein